MKRSASSAFKPVSAGYRSTTPFPTRQDNDVANNADVTGSTAPEKNQHAVDAAPGHTEPMPFPGPYVHDPAPVVVVPSGPAHDVAVPAPTTTAAVTEASSTATTSVVRGNAPAGSSTPGATRTGHPETSSRSDGKDLNPDGLPPLILAARRGNLDQLRTLLGQPGVDINQVDARFGSTALMFAAQVGNLDVVEFLLASGVDVNFKNHKSGRTALDFAAEAGKLDVVNVLLKHPDIRLDQINNNDMLALVGAARKGHANVVNALLDIGVDINFRDKNFGNTALIVASAAGKLEVVNALLKRPGVRLEETNNNGYNALCSAASFAHVDVMNALLDAGADINFGGPQSGNTVLMAACAAGRLDVVNVLLKRPGIRLEHMKNNGIYALACAAQNGHADIVAALLDAGADVNFSDPRYGCTALITASAAGKLGIVNVVLKRPGVLVNRADNRGMNALAHAAYQGHADIMGCLIDAGADMTAPNVRGQSGLHLAIAKGHANAVECLLARGAPLRDPLPMLPHGLRNMISLSDLFMDRRMPAASPDNPLHLTDPHLLEDHHIFFQALVATLNPDADGNVNKALAGWFAAQGIRHAVSAPILHSLGDLSRVWRLLAAPGQAGPTAQQKLAYCVSTLSRLGLLVPDQKIAAPYLQASLSAAGVTRLSQRAIAQRDKLLNLAEIATARLASDMLDRLATQCIASTGIGLRIDFDADALRTSMINAGFVPPLAQALVDSWRAALDQLTATPLAMPQMLSMTEMLTFIHARVTTEGPKLLVREILRQLDTQALIAEWRTTLGDTGAEGLFALFDDQCRQLRQYCEQMGKHGA